MNKLNIYLVKLLKKLSILSFFNFVLTQRYKSVKVKILVKHGIGLTNLILKPEWLDQLIERFTTDGNKSFVDVGVNIGQTLIRLKTLYPNIQYLGFEPNATCVSYVQELIKKNSYQRCLVLNVALASANGILKLQKSYDVDSRASLVAELRPDYFAGFEHIMAICYSLFYMDENIEFIKIDVEGAELEVLQGMEDAVLRFQPIITCEVLDSHNDEVKEFTQYRSDAVCQLLTQWNYKIIRLHTTVNNLIERVESIDHIKINQWTEVSSHCNDYLFYPKDRHDDVMENLIA